MGNRTHRVPSKISWQAFTTTPSTRLPLVLLLFLTLKACTHWIWKSYQFSNRIAQCEFNANPMRIDHVHTALCGIKFTRAHWLQVVTPPTQLPWRPHQIFTSASHHIASRVEQIRGTQCVVRRSVLAVGSRHKCACHALFGPHAQRAITRSRSIRIEATSGSGLGLIQIRSGLGEYAFIVDVLKPDSIQFRCPLAILHFLTCMVLRKCVTGRKCVTSWKC